MSVPPACVEVRVLMSCNRHVFVKSDTRRPMALEDGLKEGLEKLKVDEGKTAKL